MCLGIECRSHQKERQTERKREMGAILVVAAGVAQQVFSEALSSGSSMLPGLIYKGNEKEIDLL